MLNQYLALTLFWLLFFVAHSLLAADSIKRKLKLILGSYYRLFYNIISFALLIPILLSYTTMPAVNLLAPHIILQGIGAILTLAGLYIIKVGFKNYRTDEFLGTYQIKNKAEYHPTSLSLSGWNRIVRHPVYFGSILLALGLCSIWPTGKLCLSASLVIIYFYLGTLLEEQKLIKEFGDTYKQYQNDVSMLFPFIWLKNRFSQKTA